MLCQIGSCCVYADRWNRIVLVDTSHSTTEYFRDRFSNYFRSLRRNLVLDISGIRGRLAKLPMHPAQLSGRLHEYAAVAGRPGGPMVDQATGIPLTFDFARNHDHPLLVHHTWGRSRFPLQALERMRPLPAIRLEVARRMKEIGAPFTALHVRATDYQTDYRTGIAALKDKLVGPVFVATDNRQVLDFIRAECPDADIHSFSSLPEEGHPLHNLGGRKGDVYEINRDAIVDVLMLAHAKALYAFRLQPNLLGARMSGYSRLAFDLRNNRQLLAGLMSG